MNARARTSQPVALTAAGVCALVVIAAVAQPAAGVSPFVVRIAQFGLAGGAAYLLDDAAAQLTTVTPPGVWHRRMPGLVGGGAVLTAAWAAVLLVLAWQHSRPPLGTATGELVALALCALAAASVLERRGDPEPGMRVAPAVVLLGISAIIAESVLRTTLLLPWDDAGPGRGLVGAWAAGALGALVLLLVSSRDPGGGERLWVRSPRRRSTDSGSA